MKIIYRNPLIAALLAGTAVLVFSLTSQWIIYHEILGETGPMRVIGSVIAAIASATLVWHIAHDRIRDREDDIRRFEVIAAMNHHIRNALTVITFHCNPQDEAASHEIRHAVSRITWVLQEVLPGVAEDRPVAQDPRFPDGTNSQSAVNKDAG